MTAIHQTAGRPVLEVRDLHVFFNRGRKQIVHAVSDVSFSIDRRETLGLVGESGCGKSSLARAIVQLPPPTSGHVLLSGHDLTTMKGKSLRSIRANIQMVFQDPISSLNPVRRIGRAIAEPLRVMSEKDKTTITSRVRKMMAAVGLDPEQYANQLPHQLSGGQCQRVSIARALMTRPDVLICDEPVSALDVSVQAQILNLLNTLKADFGLSMLFISHDLAVVKRISDRVAVMYQGTVCELAPVDKLYSHPAHPYTAALLNAIPQPIPRNRRMIDTTVPYRFSSFISPFCGCCFHPRCPLMKPLCTEQPPQMSEIATGHLVACHFPFLSSKQADQI
ncbi:MAG: ABC transporter ATP-binding protein [Pseudomonadota bacterium]